MSPTRQHHLWPNTLDHSTVVNRSLYVFMYIFAFWFTAGTIFTAGPAYTIYICFWRSTFLYSLHNHVNNHITLTLSYTVFTGYYNSVFSTLLIHNSNTFSLSRNTLLCFPELTNRIIVLSNSSFIYSVQIWKHNHSYDRMIESSNDRMVDSSICRMSIGRMVEWSNYRMIDLSNDRIIDLSNDRIIDLSNDRIIDLSNDRVCLTISHFELRNRFPLSFNSQQGLYSLT